MYGWLGEGVLAQIMYDRFPIQLPWTSLVWHASLSVLIGWHMVFKMLQSNSLKRLTSLSVSIGILYGLWAISWLNGPGNRLQIQVNQGYLLET